MWGCGGKLIKPPCQHGSKEQVESLLRAEITKIPQLSTKNDIPRAMKANTVLHSHVITMKSGFLFCFRLTGVQAVLQSDRQVASSHWSQIHTLGSSRPSLHSGYQLKFI